MINPQTIGLCLVGAGIAYLLDKIFTEKENEKNVKNSSNSNSSGNSGKQNSSTTKSGRGERVIINNFIDRKQPSAKTFAGETKPKKEPIKNVKKDTNSTKTGDNS
jgi:hypothetical protein